MEHLIQRMGGRISTVVTWLSKDCLAMSRAFPIRFQLRSLAAMRREYVGACDEPQSETTLLLPVLPMATTQINAPCKKEKTTGALPVWLQIRICDMEIDEA